MVDFPPFFFKKDNFVTSCLPSCKLSPFEKGVFSKRKEGEHIQGSTFFPFRVQPFPEGRQNNFDRVAFPESISISLYVMLSVLKL